jgi:hypothetical protein
LWRIYFTRAQCWPDAAIALISHKHKPESLIPIKRWIKGGLADGNAAMRHLTMAEWRGFGALMGQ